MRNYTGEGVVSQYLAMATTKLRNIKMCFHLTFHYLLIILYLLDQSAPLEVSLNENKKNVHIKILYHR